MLRGTFECDREGCGASIEGGLDDVREQALERGWLLVQVYRDYPDEDVVELAFDDQFCLIAYFS